MKGRVWLVVGAAVLVAAVVAGGLVARANLGREDAQVRVVRQLAGALAVADGFLPEAGDWRGPVPDFRAYVDGWFKLGGGECMAYSRHWGPANHPPMPGWTEAKVEAEMISAYARPKWAFGCRPEAGGRVEGAVLPSLGWERWSWAQQGRTWSDFRVVKPWCAVRSVDKRGGLELDCERSGQGVWRVQARDARAVLGALLEDAGDRLTGGERRD